MQLLHLGHAGFVVEAGGIRILIDPWFFPAFLGSWFPYPDNRFLLDEVRALPIDAVYVSHLHEDHFDRRFLDCLPKTTPVLCADYRSKSLRRVWRSLGFSDVTVLGHGESVKLAPGVEATMVLDTSHREDSGLLIDDCGFRFLDLNDCLANLGDLPRDIDLLARQYSGASWYPNSYRFTPDVMREKVDTVRRNLLLTLATVCRETDARHYLPSAGPPCFLDPALSHLIERDVTTFPLWSDVAPAYATACPRTRALPILPGDRVVVVDDDPHRIDGPLHGIPELTHDAYSAARRSEWAHTSEPSLPMVSTALLQQHFAGRLRRNPDLLCDRPRRLRIAADARVWTVSFEPDNKLDVTPGEPAEPADYSLDGPEWVIREAIDRDDWEDIFLSMRVQLARSGTYDVRLMGFLRYGGRPAIADQLLRDIVGSDETVEVGGVLVQRFCPHSGEDLSLAIVSDQTIECPRHHWRWNIDTGVCVEGGTLPLRVERLPKGV
jgi:UDP-MurNAc hydroxylase